jgi:hypothetical protein
MVSYDIAVIAKLMLWDTMFDKSRLRLLILNQGEYLANLYHKEKQTLNIKYRGDVLHDIASCSVTS